jgi:hypothetical protein
MNMKSAQLCIAGTFLVGLVCNSAAVLITYAQGAIFPDNLRTMLSTLLAVYSGPLAIVTAGFFGQEAPHRKTVPSTFWIAIVVSVIWNVFVLWGGVELLASSFGSQTKETAVDDFSSYIKLISSSATFLVSGALTYFFVKRS